SVAHEIAPGGQSDQGQPRLANGLGAALQSIDEGDDAYNVRTRLPQDLHRLEARASRRDDVLEQSDAQTRAQRPIPLDHFGGAMVLAGLAHVKRREGVALLEAHEGHRAGQRTAAELDPRDGVGGTELPQRIEHQLADERVALRGEDRLFAVDEEITLPPGGEEDALALKAQRGEELDQTVSLGLVHHRL